MGPYHAIMVHFPVALWTVAAGIIIFRGVSEGPLARAFDRVLVSLLHEMGRRDAKKGLASLCIGGGMGVALAVER